MLSNETVAAIDVGSNSIKLLVGRRGESQGRIETVFTETIETRISAGISQELPRLTDEAVTAGTATIAELFGLAQEFNPREVQIVATSAVRDALNGRDFIDTVKDATGLTIRILSGSEEATTIGKGLACDPAIGETLRFIQMDLGGGSLELIRFNEGVIENAISLQLGAVRLTERLIKDRDAPIDDETDAAIRAYVRDELLKSGFPFEPSTDPLIATGGAFSVTRAILAAAAGTTIDQFRAELTQADISTLRLKLAKMPMHERLSKMRSTSAQKAGEWFICARWATSWAAT